MTIRTDNIFCLISQHSVKRCAVLFGKEKGKYETAMKLLELGAREDMIAEAVGHSVEEIKRWKNDLKRQ